MAIFGWIMLSLLATFGIAILVIFAIPFVVSEVVTMAYKLKTAIKDKMADIDKRSEAKQHRDEIKRARDFELANRKLDAKLLKVDKQIKLQKDKLRLAEELKEMTSAQKEELNNTGVESFTRPEPKRRSKREEVAVNEEENVNSELMTAIEVAELEEEVTEEE